MPIGSESLKALTGAGGRVTKDVGKMTAFSNFAAVQDPAQAWLTLELQRKHLFNLPTSRLVEIAMDLSPLVSKAFSDFLRFCNPGQLLQIDNRQGQRVADDFIERLSLLHGDVNSLYDTMFASLFVGGAYFLELVLDTDGRQAIDIAVLDPSRARFRRQDKQPRGQYWQLGQEGENPSEFIPMDGNPLIKYVPIDRLPDKPYGRPMVTSGVYSAIFLLGLVQDLRTGDSESGA